MQAVLKQNNMIIILSKKILRNQATSQKYGTSFRPKVKISINAKVLDM
jgi:hypothetical protein